MSDVKLLLTDRAGTRIGELVGASLDDCTWQLNAPGGASVGINPLQKSAAWIATNKTEIQVWIDDVYRHCVVPRAVTGNSKKITFQCEGLLGWFKYRHINDTLVYGDPGVDADPDADPPVIGVPPTYIEQLQIIWNLIAYAQTGANKDLRIASSAWTPSGIGRLRKWEWSEHQQILDIISEFPAVDRGFDFDIKLFGDGRREFTPYYPHKGTTRANLVLEWGRNVVDYTYNESGTEQGTHAWCTGGSNDGVKFEENYEDEALSAEYGVYEKIVSNGSEKDVGWLLDRATEEVTAYGKPIILPTLTVKDIPQTATTPAIKLDGVLDTGDIVPVRVNHGRCQMNGDYRIVQISRKGNGRLDLTFNEYRP